MVIEAERDAAAVLAEYAASVTYEQLPGEVVAALRNIVLDTLGAMLAANTLGTGIREMVEVARSTAGTPESTIIGLGRPGFYAHGCVGERRARWWHPACWAEECPTVKE